MLAVISTGVCVRCGSLCPPKGVCPTCEHTLLHTFFPGFDRAEGEICVRCRANLISAALRLEVLLLAGLVALVPPGGPPGL